MILPNPQSALHLSWLYRLLIHIGDHPKLSQNLYFKGGTCATMQGILDRFSVDLDFDRDPGLSLTQAKTDFEQIFKKLDLEIKDSSQKTIQYFLRYQAPKGERNTLKVEAVDTALKENQYQPVFLTEINRYLVCQTPETMLAHKLVALTNRYQKNQTLAGRDLYDIHYFLSQGILINNQVIEARTGLKTNDYLKKLIEFIKSKVTQTNIDQDLNPLLSPKKFSQIRQSLKLETMALLSAKISKK